jgi:hypothetical protein
MTSRVSGDLVYWNAHTGFGEIDLDDGRGRIGIYRVDRRWTSYRLSRTAWLRLRHALASRDEGMELVSMKEGSGLRHRWCAVVWVKENLPLQQHTGHSK